MTPPELLESQSFDIGQTPSGVADRHAEPAGNSGWAPPAWPSDNFASSRPLQKRAIGWRGRLRGRA